MGILMPGFETAMAPLNNQSVIVSVGGLSFPSVTGIQAYLSSLNTSTTVPWTEILYVQKNETPLQILRAFTPLMPRETAAASWATLARQ